MKQLFVTPSNGFKPHIWTQGGQLTESQAKHYQKQLMKLRSLYDRRKPFYLTVEIIAA